MNLFVLLYQTLIENIDYYTASETWLDLERNTFEEIVNEFRRKKGKGLQDWKVVPFERVNRIWGDYVKTGFVRDEKGINDISDLILKNIAKLNVNTILAGHTEQDPKYMFENNEIPPFNPKEEEKFMDFIIINGQWRISDYGLKPLNDEAFKLLTATTAEEKILALNRILWVIHRRGDMAANFIQGGVKALNKLSGIAEQPSQT